MIGENDKNLPLKANLYSGFSEPQFPAGVDRTTDPCRLMTLSFSYQLPFSRFFTMKLVIESLAPHL